MFQNSEELFQIIELLDKFSIMSFKLVVKNYFKKIVQRSRVQSPESRVQSPESRVQSPESRVQSPESRVQSPESSPESSPAFSLCHFKLGLNGDSFQVKIVLVSTN